MCIVNEWCGKCMCARVRGDACDNVHTLAGVVSAVGPVRAPGPLPRFERPPDSAAASLLASEMGPVREDITLAPLPLLLPPPLLGIGADRALVGASASGVTVETGLIDSASPLLGAAGMPPLEFRDSVLGGMPLADERAPELELSAPTADREMPLPLF